MINEFISHIFKATHISAPKCIEYCRGTNASYAVLEALKCKCATDHSIDLSQPVVTVPLASGETNPIRPFSKCGRSGATTMIGSSTSSTGPETIAMYRVDYDEKWSREIDRYHGTKIGSSTCNSVTKELMITRQGIFIIQ